MVEKLSCYLLDNFLYKNETIKGDQREIMLFGITRIIEDVPKYVLIALISFLLGVLKEAGIVFLITLLYKTFIGGAHARTNIICFFSSLLFFMAPIFISKYTVNVEKVWLYIAYSVVFVFSIYMIVKHAPADTEEVPILNKVKRRNYKYLAAIVLVVYYVIALVVVKDIFITNLIISTVLFVDLYATRIAYKMYSCKHSYESEEFKEYYINESDI